MTQTPLPQERRSGGATSAIARGPTLQRRPIGLVDGNPAYVSPGIIFGSLAFWVAGARSFACDLVDFTVVFSAYPGSIYQGALRLVAFTVLPASNVVLLPMQLVHAPSVATVGVVAGSALVYAALAAQLFKLGVKRYRRGLAAQA